MSIPRWLLVMRAITGVEETPGDASNPKITGMADFIARAYPEMADYCAQYTNDEIAWCGLTAAFSVTAAGLRPPFGPTDTDKFLWALAWADDLGFTKSKGRPVQGSIIVMEREGGGHVTFYEYTDDDGWWMCRGGNQSNAVTIQAYDPETVVAVLWPKDGGEQPEVPVEDRPMLQKGDSGPDVVDLQNLLPRFDGEVDGDFGEITEDAVMEYQASRQLVVDGVVGHETWTALYEHKLPRPSLPPPHALSLRDQWAIARIASSSSIAKYSWEDRGEAPLGYIQGMAMAFAQTCRKFVVHHKAAVEMAKANTGDEGKDVLAWFAQEFIDLGMDTDTAGIDTLRALYVLMMGLGMRESSGRHCCGRDMSASNTSSDTCEAGLFQTSYDAHTCHPTFDQLFEEYENPKNEMTCYLDVFASDVECSDDDWDNYGSGDGYDFQKLCKSCPAFAVETAGIALRNRRQHYGPINRKEVELLPEADELFREVQYYLSRSRHHHNEED